MKVGINKRNGRFPVWRIGRMYVYKKTEGGEFPVWTVGHYTPHGIWEPESDHPSSIEAADRVVVLHGGQVSKDGDKLQLLQEAVGIAIKKIYTDKTKAVLACEALGFALENSKPTPSHGSD